MSDRTCADPSQRPDEIDWYAELERLVERHELGEISDDEFAREKQRILRRTRQRTKDGDTGTTDDAPNVPRTDPLLLAAPDEAHDRSL